MRGWMVSLVLGAAACGGGQAAAVSPKPPPKTAPVDPPAPPDETAPLVDFVHATTKASELALRGKDYDRALDCPGDDSLAKVDDDSKQAYAELGPQTEIVLQGADVALAARAKDGAWVKTSAAQAFVFEDGHLHYRVKFEKEAEQPEGPMTPLASAPPSVRAAFVPLLAGLAHEKCDAPIATIADFHAIPVATPQRKAFDELVAGGDAPREDACALARQAEGEWSISGDGVGMVVSGQGAKMGLGSADFAWNGDRLCVSKLHFHLIEEGDGAGGGEKPEDKPAKEDDDVDPPPRTTDPAPLTRPANDRDGDGVPDDQDACPDVAGSQSDDAKTNGCP